MPVSWLPTETLVNVEPEVWKRNANMNFSCWKVEGFRVMGGEGWVVDIGGNRTSDVIIVAVEDNRITHRSVLDSLDLVPKQTQICCCYV